MLAAPLLSAFGEVEIGCVPSSTCNLRPILSGGQILGSETSALCRKLSESRHRGVTRRRRNVRHRGVSTLNQLHGPV
jgi:hypothetical protein